MAIPQRQESAFLGRRGKYVGVQRSRLRRIVNEMSELPGIRLLTEPYYRRRFRAHRRGNAYYGAYASFEAAARDIPPGVPAGYDSEAATRLYAHRLEQVEASDYPALFWLQKLVEQGARRIFDLGGHVGVSYYAFRKLITYPDDLQWQVHDVAAVMESGRKLAGERDEHGQLSFVERDAADGCDVFMAKGALQYLDYALPDFLRGLRDRPRHLLINLTPMHPARTVFTLQHIGVAVCPYRISATGEFVRELEALGYRQRECWEHHDRAVRIPYHPEASIDRYHGYCFTHDRDAS